MQSSLQQNVAVIYGRTQGVSRMLQGKSLASYIHTAHDFLLVSIASIYLSVLKRVIC